MRVLCLRLCEDGGSAIDRSCCVSAQVQVSSFLFVGASVSASRSASALFQPRQSDLVSISFEFVFDVSY